MGTTNYHDTFIGVAADCPVSTAEEPPVSAKGATVAALQYELIAEHPYAFTSDDVLFRVHAIRQEIAEEDQVDAREASLAKDQACLRSSPLGKRYGWGIHHDPEGRVALVALGTEQYAELASDTSLTQTSAMRSRRA